MVLLFILFILIGTYYAIVFVGGIVIDWIFGKEDDEKSVFIDRSTHNHTHFHVHTSNKSKEIKELENYIEVGSKTE